MASTTTGFTEVVANYCAGATDDFICKIFNFAQDEKLKPHRALFEKLITDRTVDGAAAERAVLAFLGDYGFDREKLIAAYSTYTSKMISSALSMLTIAYIPLFIFMLIILAIIASSGYGKFALVLLIIFVLVYVIFLIIAYYCAQWYANSMLNDILAYIEKIKNESGAMLAKANSALIDAANAYLAVDPATPPVEPATQPPATATTTPTPARPGKARPQKAKLGDVELRVVQADERSGCISTASSDLDDLSSSNH